MQQLHHSLSLTTQGHKEVERQLRQKQWTIHQLAEAALVNVAIVNRFQAEEPVDHGSFVRLCAVLNIPWEAVTERSDPCTLRLFSSGAQQRDDLDASLSTGTVCLFRRIQHHCRNKILSQYRKIRLLNQKLIDIDQLYVDVYLLETSARSQDCQSLGRWSVRQSSFVVANNQSHLLILGKPGSGKTTLLQQFATACCNGNFKPDLIPVWIDLRQVDQSNWHFLNFLLVAMDLYPPAPNSQERIQARNQLNSLLIQGKLLILLDGLDEVPIAFRKKVQDQICWLLQHPVYRKNHVILSCQTPSIGLLQNHLFTTVKIADLNDRQVEKFVKAWSQTVIDSQGKIDHQWQYFLKLVAHTLASQDLTTTPLLLGLACWIFENTGELPHQVSQFYEQAIGLLLTNWRQQPQDSSSLGLKRAQSQIYQKLTVHDRKQILMEIAIQKIEKTPNFVLFNQTEIVNHITQTLQLNHYRDGLAVLHTIAAQQGLLTEQANHQWSFSHLTFQEYFITQWLLSLPLAQLAEKITSQPWQQTIDQIVRSQKQADSLIKVIKQAIDQMVAQDAQLQTFLDWVNQKTNTLAAPYKPAAVRMFYLGLALALTGAPSHDLARARALDAALAIDVTLDLDFDFNLDLDFALVRVLARALDFDFDRALALARALARALDCTLALVHAPALALDCALDGTLAIDLIRALDCALDCTRTLAPELTCYLEHHKAAILTADQGGVDTFLIWWQAHGQSWIEQLRWVMIEYRNIGHAWQFNRQQQDSLQQYEQANQFLVQLLKITGAVSQETRQQIEATLFLPIEVVG